VQLANGTAYTIPTGVPGTFAWARQAALISDAYAQLGADEIAATWWAEWQRRDTIRKAIEAGQDRAAIWQQFGRDLLTAPAKIFQDIGGAVITVGNVALGGLRVLPLVAVGLVVALAAVAIRGQAPAVLKAVRS
jgi:hypothetical protein